MEGSDLQVGGADCRRLQVDRRAGGGGWVLAGGWGCLQVGLLAGGYRWVQVGFSCLQVGCRG